MRRYLIFILSLLGCVTGVFANSNNAISTTNIHEYTLNNGLKLIVLEDHRTPVVLSSIWYKVGGSYEHNGITGLSHMLEHMMFRGTQTYKPGQFKTMIYNAGGQQNAMTSPDFTMYYQKLPAAKLALSLRLEADRMHNLIINNQAFSHEKKVVQEERRMRFDDNPQALAWLRFRSAAFINSPYSHPVIGWKNDIKNYTLSDLQSWYRMWYTPDNAVLVVVGDEKPLYVLGLVRKYFGSIEPRVVPELKPRIEVASLGKQMVNINLNAKLPMIYMGYKVPSLVTTKDQWQAYALEVLEGVLDLGGSSRLSVNLIHKDKVAVSADVDYDLYSLHSGLFEIDAVPANGRSLLDLQNSILAQIKLLKEDLVGENELARAKAQLISTNIYSKDSLMSQAMQIGMPEMIGLSWAVGRDFTNRINAVTPSQIRQVAKLYFNNDNLTVGKLNILLAKKTTAGVKDVKEKTDKVAHK